MEVVVGTYEELILCYKAIYDGQNCVLQTNFTDHSHNGCVRCVAVSENGFLASGSSDESIRLFNLKRRTEVGSLVHHNGYISSLAFFGKSHMFSCSADGTIAIWRVGKWECEKILRGHKDVVLSVSIHPSGKLALSLSHNKMRTWNLLTGKCAYVTNIKNGEIVRWTPDGKNYIVVSRDTVQIYSVETAAIIDRPKFDFRINCAHFIKNHVLAVGGEGGNVHFYDMKNKLQVHELCTDTIRVKDMSVCEVEGKTKLITGSSDGYIKVWNVTLTEENWQTKLESSVDTKFRIVSLAVRLPTTEVALSGSDGRVKKRQRSEVDNEASMSDSSGSEDEGEEDMEDAESDKEDSMEDSNSDLEEEISEDDFSDEVRIKKKIPGNSQKRRKQDSGTEDDLSDENILPMEEVSDAFQRKKKKVVDNLKKQKGNKNRNKKVNQQTTEITKRNGLNPKKTTENGNKQGNKGKRKNTAEKVQNKQQQKKMKLKGKKNKNKIKRN